MTDPRDPYDGIPTYEPNWDEMPPDPVADCTEGLPNPPDPKTGLRE